MQRSRAPCSPFYHVFFPHPLRRRSNQPSKIWQTRQSPKRGEPYRRGIHPARSGVASVAAAGRESVRQAKLWLKRQCISNDRATSADGIIARFYVKKQSLG